MYETYYNKYPHTLRSGEFLSTAIIMERHFVVEEQWVEKPGVSQYFALCQAINVNSTFSHEWRDMLWFAEFLLVFLYLL